MANPSHRKHSAPERPARRPFGRAERAPHRRGREREDRRARPARPRPRRWRVDIHRLISRLLLVVILAWAAVTMVQQQLVIIDLERELRGQQGQLLAAQEQQDLLIDETEALSTAEAIEAIARTRLGYIRPDEILFIITEDPELAGRLIIDTDGNR